METHLPLRPDLAAAIASARQAEFVSRRDLPAAAPRPARRDRRNTVKSTGAGPLRLCYLVPRTDVGGGARVLFEHANRLHGQGHEVTVLSHFPPPTWYDLRPAFWTVPFGVELAEAVPDCDVIVAGYWDQVVAARSLGVAPVVHFEQGDSHLFEDLDPAVHAIVAGHLDAADATLTVSGTVADVLRDRFGVASKVVGNAIDPAVFHPSTTTTARDPKQRPYVLFVGWDGNEFKGMAEMRQVWRALSAERSSLDLVWVTPKPAREPVGRVVVAPDQATLGALFRGAEAYICCSHYESFSLPCLEAMASGTPVVATSNTGVLEYARDGVNALLADVRDVDGLLTQVRRVLDEPALAARLREGGLRTAASYSWDTIITKVEGAYRAAQAAWSPAPLGDWRFDLSGLRFDQPHADVERRLKRRAAATTAAALAVPVAFPAFEGHRSVRWQVVGRRQDGGGERAGVARAYLLANTDAPPTDLPYATALHDFTEGRLDTALQGFLDLYQRGGPLRTTVCRWIVLTLLELGRDEQAAAVVEAGVQGVQGHSDFHYLRAMTGLLTGRTVDGAAYVDIIDTLGPASHFDEWFDEPDMLVRQRLLATAAPA